jgi:hypothetical protein
VVLAEDDLLVSGLLKLEAAPFSWWGIANTLVTVATLLIPFRFLVEPGRNKRIACAGLRPWSTGPWDAGDVRYARCVPYQPVTDSRDDVVTLTPAFRGFWYVTIRQ